MLRRVLALIGVLIFLASCNTNNINNDTVAEKQFRAHHVTGSFAMWDNAKNVFDIYNMKRYRDSVYSPASTFKIFNSLVALNTSRVFSDTVVVPWDGVVRTLPNGDTAYKWNKDMDMREAFKVSSVPFYQEMARRIGRDTMQFWLDSVKYGNRKIGDKIDEFWLNNTLTITADEQLGFVKRLYFKQLPFQNVVQEMVKDMMIQEKTDIYTLAYKTGWGKTKEGNELGWVVGWIEENKHVYFFVLNLESPDHKIDMAAVRKDLLNGILKEKGFFEGKR
ncbi:penicillin-binding transpeptidase domain-containing protein [Polluticaenibacter yanchengensis]|uniref:beta-lactamase n=1 Tax=Polluticaenibacter yanchengensis TaxID=3014562 RepID=A0ABT4ULP2_9BACT|nr:penicillin-binding transpeptidase domain-containing protein [Chitinophagaceae bacterium LY-5]